MTEFIITFCTCPDLETAESIARMLIENKQAACVNILPGMTSIYAWKGQIESTAELLLVIKSAAQSYEAIESAIRSRHPYEIPEIIAMPVERGLPDYLSWMNSCHA